MGRLIKREWKRWRKKLVVSLVLQILILLAALILCIWKRAELPLKVYLFFLYPKELTALTGYGFSDGVGNIAYYLLFVMMFLNVDVIWKACTRTLRIVYMDEENQSLYSMCNQIYSRQKLVWSKFFWAQVSALVGYIVLSCSLWVMIVIGNFGQGQETDWQFMALQAGRVMIVMIMMVSLTFLYAVWTKNIEGYTKSGYVSCLVFGTFMLGNLHKLRDVLFWMMRKAGVSVGKAGEATGWMDELDWVSPLSWINPAKEFSGTLMAICAGIALMAGLVGMIGYRRRKL